MEKHYLATLFPKMDTNDFQSLKEDIQTQGQLEPITTYNGKILDGQHRYQACIELGIEPSFVPYEGNSPLLFVIAKNANRRHLTSSQRAAIALTIEKELAKEAKKRQLATLKQNATVPQIIAEREKAEAREQAAALMNTNRQYVSDAKKLQKTKSRLIGTGQRGGDNHTRSKADCE